MWRTFAVVMVMGVVGGCGPLKLPRLPRPIQTPGTAVTAVHRVARGPDATRYHIVVSLYNPNDEPLPLTLAQYELSIGGHTYRTDTVPSTTIPATGRIEVTLPGVAVAAEAAGEGEYETSGRLTITPAGEVRRLLYTIGWPKPRARFQGRGPITPATDQP